MVRVFTVGFIRHSYWLMLLGLLIQCVSTRYLLEDEQRLLRARIRSVHTNERISHSDLRQKLVQTHNKRFVLLPWWIPKVEWYYHGLKNYDKEKYFDLLERKQKILQAKIARKPNRKVALQAKGLKFTQKIEQRINNGNIWMRLGEDFVRYDKAATQQSVAQIRNYLHKKGFFKSKVDVLTYKKTKSERNTYLITPGPAYVVDSASYVIEEQKFKYLSSVVPLKKWMPKGTYYTEKSLNLLQERLYKSLLDSGFYAFPKDHIRFLVDSVARGRHKLWVQAYVQAPTQAVQTHRYICDTLSIHIDSVHYHLTKLHDLSSSLVRSHKPFVDKIRMQAGRWYNEVHKEQTQQLLEYTDMFQNVYITSETIGKSLHTHIQLSPYKKYDLSSEAGMEISQGAPSPFVSTGLKVRNFFRSLEIIEGTLRFTLVGLSTPTSERRPYRSFQYAAQFSVNYPSILLPFTQVATSLDSRKRTLLSLYLEFTDRETYQRAINQFSLTYHWQASRSLSYSLRLINMSLISSNISNTFRRQIRTSFNSFSNSFQSALVHSIYGKIRYNKNYTGFGKKPGYEWQIHIETGGHLNNLFQQLTRKNNLTQYVFSTFRMSYVHSVPLGRQSNLVWRLTGGLIASHLEDRALPYEKYFFIGGSNSMRAWPPRRLGPGSYQPLVGNNTIEQPGEILLEANLEYRMQLAGKIQGALFTDVGNIWLRKGTSLRRGVSFLWPQAIQELAVAVGAGIRIDLSFVLLRLDLGIKAYDPSVAQRFVLPQVRLKDILGRGDLAIFSLGINYPF